MSQLWGRPLQDTDGRPETDCSLLYGGEVKALAQRWGEPRLIEKRIPVAPGLAEKTVRGFFSDRWGEVMMVIRRRLDGLVWVMTKESFPLDCGPTGASPQRLYSLPTGGIRHAEAIAAALWRELGEETGFEAQVRQFLAVIRYEPVLAQGAPQGVPDFVSYVFLLEEVSGNHPVVATGERILDFKAVAPSELLNIAQQWGRLSGSSAEFHDLAAWGMFRSIAHQVVGEMLMSEGK